MNGKRILCLLLAALMLSALCGCGRTETVSDEDVPLFSLFSRKSGSSGAAEEDRGPYIAPAFLDSAYHPSLAEGPSNARIDLSALSEGYVAVSAVSSQRLKFQVIMGEYKYNYDLASDGTPSVFPLPCGDGQYTFRVMENVTESRYAEIFSATRQVVLLDEFQPFLRPNAYVNYTQDSACVKKAQELAETAGDAMGLVGAVFRFVCETVTYDTQKASTVRSGYVPTPDETMATGKGICFDYASLAGAMLRSQGIPTREVFGYVSPNGVYHAWNMFYTEQTGWVTVSYEVREGWNRLDLTFSANGADADFIGDGSNYSEVFYF